MLYIRAVQEETVLPSGTSPRRSRAALLLERDGDGVGAGRQQQQAQQGPARPAEQVGQQEFEDMYASLNAVLAGVPDLEASVVSGFLSSFVQLHEARRVQHDQLTLWAGQGRLDLVRQWVLRAEELY